MRTHSDVGREVVRQEAAGLEALAGCIDANFAIAVSYLNNGRFTFFSGVGKSGHIGRKLAATFSSMGSPAAFIHPTEAAHGDMGMMGINDTLVALSRSGKALELYPIISRARDLGMPTILISECDDNYLALRVDVTIKLPQVSEAWGHAPTTSTIMQMALGDALAVALAEEKGYNWDNFKDIHPGGVLSEKG